MNKSHKSCTFTLILILLLNITSLITVSTAIAAVPKPSVPEFTATFVDRSYDVPATSSIDPYTGQNVIQPAHRIENYTVDLTIKNQPYTPTVVGEGNSTWTASFTYDVNIKGHFAQNWTIMYLIGEGPKHSNSEYTVITYQLATSPTQPDQGYTLGSNEPNLSSNTISGIPPNSQIDFRVRALIGAIHRGYDPTAKDQLSMFPWVFDGETGDWSNTQTITIPGNVAPESSTTPTPTATIDNTPSATSVSGNLQTADLALIAAGTFGVFIILVVALLAVRKHRKVAK